MDRDQYLLLFEKFLAGDATPEETDMVMLYRDQFEVSDLGTEDTREQYLEVESRILKKLNANINGKKSIMIHFPKWWAAAAILLIAIGAVFYKTYQKQGHGEGYSNNIIKKNSINPGSNKALLTLANGKQIVLNDASSETIIKQGNLVARRKTNGVLQYESLAGAGKNEEINYNTITIPRGGQYQVILPDGTRVWLNSESSLKYPTVFRGNDRTVELTGEGYFEVVNNKKMPFKVKFKGEVAEDLGTHFDIMAYDDEGETRTTLLEGSMKVTKGNFYRVLVPGQQTVSANNQRGFTIENADAANVLAWKNGYFLFQNEDIEHIMRQVARWYNVDVVYQGNRQDQVYGGRISRFKNISELLNNLELTGTIHFEVEGRRVTVMK